MGDGLVTVTGTSANFTITSAGIDGNFMGSVAINVPSVVNFTTDLTVDIDTTDPANRYVRVEGTGVDLEVADQMLTGNFTLEQSTSTSGEQVIKAAVSAVNLEFGPSGSAFVNINDGNGQMIFSSQGVVARLLIPSATLNVPGLLSGSFAAEIQISTVSVAVTEAFEIGGQIDTLELPAGPFVRVEVVNVTVDIDGNELEGDFLFQQSMREDETTLTLVAVADVEITFAGDGEVGLTDGEGAFLITADGIAGFISGTAALEVEGITAGGELFIRINTTPNAVDETIELNGRTLRIQFSDTEVYNGTSNFFDVSISNLSLNIGNFVTVEGNVTFGDKTLSDGVTTASVFAGEGLDIFLGQGPASLESGDINPLATGILLSDGRIGLIRLGTEPNTTFALFAEGTVSLIGVEGITLTGTAVVRVNTTGMAINETLTIPGSTGDGVLIQFDTTAEVTTFEALGAELSVIGQTLSGDFSFERVATGNGAGDVRIAASNVSLILGDGSSGIVSVTGGQGALLLTGTGLAGEVSGTVTMNVPGVSFDGSFTIAVNTMAAPVSEVFVVGGQEIVLNLPAGPFLRVAGEGVSLAVLEQTLDTSNDFHLAQGLDVGVAENVTRKIGTPGRVDLDRYRLSNASLTGAVQTQSPAGSRAAARGRGKPPPAANSRQ